MIFRMVADDESQEMSKNSAYITSNDARRINEVVGVHKNSVAKFEDVLSMLEYFSACTCHGLKMSDIVRGIEMTFPQYAPQIAATLKDIYGSDGND